MGQLAGRRQGLEGERCQGGGRLGQRPGQKTSARNRGDRWRRRLGRGKWYPDDKVKREAADAGCGGGRASRGRQCVSARERAQQCSAPCGWSAPKVRL